MRRREVLAALGSVILLGQHCAAAQTAKVPTIGVLVIGEPDPARMLRVFRDELQKLGYVEDRNVHIDIRSAGGDLQRLPELAAELADDKVNVVATWMTPAVLAAKKATASVPIVMFGAADPVGMGIVTSLARPGGNVTGLSGLTVDLTIKVVALLKEMLPELTRVAALCNTPDPFSKLFRDQVGAAGKANGIEIEPMMVAAGTALDAAFPAMNKTKITTAIVQPSLPLAHVAELALQHRIATAAPLSLYARAGGLMSYANDPDESPREAAVFVDKILKGAKPADLPVEQPTRFELVINMKAAKALGLTVPQVLLAQANEVIE